MDDRRILFIIHCTDNNSIAQTLASIENLRVPEGYSVGILPITGGLSKYSAYNIAMRSSDAKYKIYIDEYVSIIDDDILSKLIKIFQSDDKIGMIGCSGATQLSTHGFALSSVMRCGKVCLMPEQGVKDWGEIPGDYSEVETVDGWFMATQYDIKWRDDLFKDTIFGNQAQCIEFRRKGYKVVAVSQGNPWVWQRLNNFPINEESRQKFLDEYSRDIFPLVSIVIPTYNRPEYFKIALESVLSQTYKNIEIFITDNSPTRETAELMENYLAKYPFIEYEYHEDFDAGDNWRRARAYNNPKAEYVNWLMDDDMYYPKKIELMVEAYRNNPDVSIVGSKIDSIDENGKLVMKSLDIMPSSGKMIGHLAGRLLFINDNYLYDPTAILIKKECLRDNDLCWDEREIAFSPLIDVSTWLKLLTEGNLFWFNESLSALRHHAGEVTYKGGTGVAMMIHWANLMKKALDERVFLTDEYGIKRAFFHWYRGFTFKMEEALNKGYNGEEVAALQEVNIAMAEALNNGYKIEMPTSALKFVTDNE